METTAQYQSRLWQADYLNNAAYDRAETEARDLEQPARVEMRRQVLMMEIRSSLSTVRKQYLSWAKVLKTQPAYAAKHGAVVRSKLADCARRRSALLLQLAGV